jgi:hypothetical protein
MTLFDLLFILVVLATLASLFWSALCAVRGRFGRASRVFTGILVADAVYMALVIAVSALSPQLIVKLGEPQCFDDYCASVDAFRHIPQGASVEYRVDLRLFSRALRGSEREKNLMMYLTDSQGRRYDPAGVKSSAPYTILLAPQESALVTRSFSVPAGAADLGAVVTHEGGFPIRWLIIGYDTWFRKPPVVMLR